MIIIKYGVQNNYLDVTNVALRICVSNKILRIPPAEHSRVVIFGDPVFGTLKHICIEINNIKFLYMHGEPITVDLSGLYTLKSLLNEYDTMSFGDGVLKVQNMHTKLQFSGGNISEEFPEQVMATMYIQPDNKVLEIGSNLGRNTLIIASLLSDQNNFVTLECDPVSYDKLLINRDLNKYTFNAENSALSYRPLILCGWDSKPYDGKEVPDNYVKVNTITFGDLEEKYNIVFDTIVADCEGALYYILMDNDNVLDNINTIIMENDYHQLDHKTTVDSIMLSKGFKRVFVLGGGWGPCINNFYEVWKK
jgi:hypothetical protein